MEKDFDKQEKLAQQLFGFNATCPMRNSFRGVDRIIRNPVCEMLNLPQPLFNIARALDLEFIEFLASRDENPKIFNTKSKSRAFFFLPFGKTNSVFKKKITM